MAKVYDVPEQIKVPDFNWEDIDQYNKDCDKFKADLRQWCVDRAARAGVTDENIGEIIRFPVADGYAEYMVACLKPVQLIHIPLWDAWEFGYAHRLTKKDIIEDIKKTKAINKIFGGKGK